MGPGASSFLEKLIPNKMGGKKENELFLLKVYPFTLKIKPSANSSHAQIYSRKYICL